jgi:nucleotide-binding universal stress UspA family protein
MEVWPRTILLATDGSEDAALAARAATDLAEKAGAGLYVVHVVR